jgi:hypothetical protein
VSETLTTPNEEKEKPLPSDGGKSLENVVFLGGDCSGDLRAVITFNYLSGYTPRGLGKQRKLTSDL